MYQFDNFLRYINLNITSSAKVGNAIQLFGSCMHKEARSYFETHIGPTPMNEEGVKVQRTIDEWNKIKGNFIQRFHPLGRTTEQLEFKFIVLTLCFVLELWIECEFGFSNFEVFEESTNFKNLIKQI